MMETNFIKADSENLPKIDAIMVGLFFKNNPDFYPAELKKLKTEESSRECYGDDAVGYVQLFRQPGICTVKCLICPEYKEKAKYYSVTLVVDEINRHVISCQCHECAAVAGGCMHAAAFLLWVHRHSEQPFCTPIECYWKEPMISQMGGLKFITVDQLVKNKVRYESNNGVLIEFIKEAKKRKIENCGLLKYIPD